MSVRRISSITGAFSRNSVTALLMDATQDIDRLFNPSIEIHGLEGALSFGSSGASFVRSSKISVESPSKFNELSLSTYATLMSERDSSDSGIWSILRKLRAKLLLVHPNTRCFSAGRCTSGITTPTGGLFGFEHAVMFKVS